MLNVLDQPEPELAIPQVANESLNALKTLFGDAEEST
jgi:hypothetical protein